MAEREGWGRVERETPEQTSDRIIKQMRDNADAARKLGDKK